MSETPSPWLVANLDLLPRGAAVLDVACGKGRNALYLARAGWRVHAIDRDEHALATLSAAAAADSVCLSTQLIDLESGAPVLGIEQYGAVLVFNYLYRPLIPVIVNAVARGGVLIYETFTAGQALRGHPRNPAFLLRDNELSTLVSPLEVVRSREGEFDGRLVSSIVATRR